LKYRPLDFRHRTCISALEASFSQWGAIQIQLPLPFLSGSASVYCKINTSRFKIVLLYFVCTHSIEKKFMFLKIIICETNPVDWVMLRFALRSVYIIDGVVAGGTLLFAQVQSYIFTFIRRSLYSVLPPRAGRTE